MFFNPFPYLIQRKSFFCHFFSCSVFNIAFYLSKRISLRNSFYFEESWFVLFLIPGHWAEEYRFPVDMFLAGLSKTSIYLPIGTFRGGKNFCKNFSLFSFLYIGPKSSDFWKFFPANCRNCFLSFQKLKLRKIVPANLVFLQSFSDIERKIVKYCRDVSVSTFKTAFKVSKSVPWGNFISFKIDDIFQISCGLQQKKLKNRLLWKLFFFFIGHSVKICRLLSKSFWQGCENCIPSVHKKHLVILFSNKVFF